MDEPIDFEQLAAQAVAAGLFEMEPAATRSNLFVIQPFRKLPVTMLDGPYGNGPTAIRVFEQDVPEASVYAVRHNFTAANALLLPLERVLLYFHNRFAANNVFRSASFAALVDDYQAPRVEAVVNDDHPGYKADELSFRVHGVDRITHDRFLYTRVEHVEGLRLVERDPDVVLAILAYQAVLADYLRRLRDAFARMAEREPSRVHLKDLSDFEDYCTQWISGNFTYELIPAIAIFRRRRRDAGLSDRIDGELFQRAMDFIVTNGAFRNWVTVPASVAADHQERVNHFLCPAVGAIRQQLGDGALLEQIYGITREKRAQHDRVVNAFADRVRAEAAEKLRDSDRPPFTVTIGDEVHRLQVDSRFALFMRGQQQPADAVVEGTVGSRLFDVMRSVVNLAIEWNAAVYFNFNGTGYRVSPERVAAFLERRDGRP